VRGAIAESFTFLPKPQPYIVDTPGVGAFGFIDRRINMAPSAESTVPEPDAIDMEAPLKAAPKLVAPEPGTQPSSSPLLTYPH
jgi:hypothetical protein